MNTIEEELNARAAQEIVTKQMAPNIMAKAFVDAAGDEKRSVILYIEMRVEQLRQELAEEVVRREAEQREAARRCAGEQQRRVEQELRAKMESEELDVINSLDPQTRDRYLKVRTA